MSAKYGVNIHLSGPKDDEDKCLAEMTASLRKSFTDSCGEVSYTLPAVPGSYWASVRKSNESDDITIGYMMTTPEFWGDLHDEAITGLVVQWPSLTLFMYGDSFENGDGFRLLYIDGKLIVDDVFHLDRDDAPTDIRRRVYGDGINQENLLQNVPERYVEYFEFAERDSLTQTWDEVRAEVGEERMNDKIAKCVADDVSTVRPEPSVRS